MKKLSYLITLALTSFCCLCACSQPAANNGGNNEPDQQEDGVRNGYYENVEDEDGNIYTGWFKDGLYDGYGELEYTTGTIYRGEFSEGKWSGVCYILWDSGCIYVGEAGLKSKMHGIGYMLWTMGDYYVGEWYDGNPNGFGLKGYMVNATGEEHQDRYNLYMGTMKNNYKIGFGLMRYYFGDIYYGDWKGDVRSGQGTVLWASGATNCYAFTGEFKNDWIDGEGVMTYRNGKIVHGIFDGIECVQEIEVLNEGAPAAATREVEDALHAAEAIPHYTDSDSLLTWAHAVI